MNWNNRYLIKRGERWYYRRRVPEDVVNVLGRTSVKIALKTDSLKEARIRRDALVEADDQYWASLHIDESSNDNAQVTSRYIAAKKRALARGFIYTPMATLVEPQNVDELIDRVLVVGDAGQSKPLEAEAILGNAPLPSVTIEEAFDFYCAKLAIGETANKSAAQVKLWRKAKYRAITNFVSVVGNLDMDKITRAHGKMFYEWWGARLRPSGNEKPLRPNSANRDLGTLRKLYREYWEYEGQDERDNPFKKLRFQDKGVVETPAFEVDWVRSKILRPAALEGLNSEAAMLVYALIETGCRPSEIANLKAHNIKLEANIPYIEIRSRQDRELKTAASNRDIPLVGVSLEAMKKMPRGFKRYRDKSAGLSALLMKSFRAKGLFPTENHRIYSFRHAFEKRMLEAGIDYGLRCILMGHKNTRPSYGDGGSMEYRRDQLLKIAHPISQTLIDRICASS